MKIVFILEYYHPHIGGVESLFKQLIDRLASQGNQIIVITNRYDSRLQKIEKHPNLVIRRYRFFNRYLFTFLAWIPLLKYARGASLIHTTSFNAAIPARIAAKMYKLRSVITFHELWGNLWFELPQMNPISARLHYLFEKLISRFRFDRYIAVSDYTAASLSAAGIEPERIARIYNGIDYSRFEKYSWTGGPGDVYSFLFFGRISYSKGVDLLLDAIRILIDKKISAFRLTLAIPASDDPLNKWLYEEIKSNQIESHIALLRGLSDHDLYTVISGHDAVVIPSYSEGFCFAAAETMAIGTPIVSSGKGALSEVIGGKYIQMNTFDARSLADAMERAIRSDWQETEKKFFPIGNTVDGYLKIYEELI